MHLVGYVSVNDFDGFVMPVFKEGNALYYQDFNGTQYFASKYPYPVEIHFLEDASFDRFDLSKGRIFAIKARQFVKAGYANEILKTIEEEHLFEFFDKEEIEFFKEKYCNKAIVFPKRIRHNQRSFFQTKYVGKRSIHSQLMAVKRRNLGTAVGLLYHVSKHQTSGKWQVGYAKKVVKTFTTRTEAMSYARKMAVINTSSAKARNPKTPVKAKLIKK